MCSTVCLSATYLKTSLMTLFDLGSVVISRPWSRDSSALEFICPGLGLGLSLETWRPRFARPRSWSQDSMLGAYACSTITVICSTFKRVLCHQSMQPVLWSRDHGLETRVHFVQDLVSVSRPEIQGLGLGFENWRPRSRSWSRDLKKFLTTTLDQIGD